MAHHLAGNWLESCTEELDLPGSPWHEVKERISKYLAERIRVEGLTNDELAKVRYLLGSEFNAKHKLLDSETKGCHNLKRPSIQDEKLESLLKDLTLKASKDARCHLQEDLTESPDCFRSTVALATKIFNSSLDSCIYASKMSRYTQFGFNSSVLKVNSLVDREIEIFGEAVVKIVQKEPARLSNIMIRLRGRLLPLALRRIIYRFVLVKMQKESKYPGSDIGVGVLSHDEKITQQGLREAFAKGVKAGLKELNSKEATKSPLRHLIQMSVIEAYETMPGLRVHSSNMEVQSECARILNILYTYSLNYQNTSILWLFPLQVTISQDRYAKEHDYELAMWLNCIIKSCFPATSKLVNNIVGQVWKELLSMDAPASELPGADLLKHFDHLGVKCNQKDVENILHLELPHNGSTSYFHKIMSPSSSNSQLDSGGTSEDEDSVYEQNSHWSLSHPALCIRKWIMDLFVSVTDLPVTMFIWDQFFLYNWNIKVYRFACLALIQTIHGKLLTATNADDLCALMLNEPVNTQLHGIHEAWNSMEWSKVMTYN